MNKILKLTATSILLTGMSLTQPLLAEDAVAKPIERADNLKDEVKQFLTKKFSFTVQHRINRGKPLPKETLIFPVKKIKDRPGIVLDAFRESFLKHIDKSNKEVVNITSAIDVYLPDRLNRGIGHLPTMFMVTKLNSDGSANSQLFMPDEKRQIKHSYRDGSGKADVYWKGLNGKLSFSKEFKSVTTQLNFLGITLNTEKGSSLSWAASTLNGKFNHNLTPYNMEWSLPEFKVNYVGTIINLIGMFGKLEFVEIENGLKIGNLDFKLQQANFKDKKTESKFDNLSFKLNSEKQGDVINIAIQEQINNFVLPNKDSAIDYLANININNIDAKTIYEIQETMRTLRTVEDDHAKLSILLGKLMQVVPQFLAKSPEIVVTDFNVTTPKGNIKANANINIDGKKAIGITPSVLLAAIGTEINFTEISKHLVKSALMDKALHDLSAEKSADVEKLATANSEAALKKYIAENWLADLDDKNYKLIIQFKDNKLVVNGKEKEFSLF
jgi:hypothetical protein